MQWISACSGFAAEEILIDCCTAGAAAVQCTASRRSAANVGNATFTATVEG